MCLRRVNFPPFTTFLRTRHSVSTMPSFWLMKAEPDARIVKGKDVKFSVDDFEACRTTAWEGVRNHEAKNIMRKQMKVGDKVFFYHSNCKTPGIAATAEVSKEAYPDYTANDPAHPYYDPKSSSRAADTEPVWWMVELTFGRRLKHFVPLSLLRSIAASPTIKGAAQLGADSGDEQSGLLYLTPEDLLALKTMPLLNRGRLSVQPVNEGAWSAINVLGERGGWNDDPKPKRLNDLVKSSSAAKPAKLGKRKMADSEKQHAPSQTDCPAVDSDPREHASTSQLRRSKRLRT